MIEAWRLVRNPYGRAAYERLRDAGVTATLMTEYGLRLPAPASDRPEHDVTTDVVAPDRVAAIGAPTAALQPDEVVIAALDGGSPVGYLFCSLDATHVVDPLERVRSFDGAYLRRVFVAPEHRDRGVATALVSTACEWAHERDAGSVTALVARDNVPSRRLFERGGFEPERSHLYIRLGSISVRRTFRDFVPVSYIGI